MLQHTPDAEAANAGLAGGKDVIRFALRLIEAFDGCCLVIDFLNVIQIIQKQIFVCVRLREVSIGIFLVLHGEPAGQTPMVEFMGQLLLFVGKELIPRRYLLGDIHQFVFRRDAETLDHLHPAGLSLEVRVFRPGFPAIIVAVPIGAVHDPGALLLEALALDGHKIRQVVVPIRKEETGRSVRHDRCGNHTVHRSVFRAIPHLDDPGWIAFAVGPENGVHLVQETPDSFLSHRVVGLVGVVSQVNIRERIYRLHTQHIAGCLPVLGRQRRSQRLVAGTNPLHENIGRQRTGRN